MRNLKSSLSNTGSPVSRMRKPKSLGEELIRVLVLGSLARIRELFSERWDNSPRKAETTASLGSSTRLHSSRASGRSEQAVAALRLCPDCQAWVTEEHAHPGGDINGEKGEEGTQGKEPESSGGGEAGMGQDERGRKGRTDSGPEGWQVISTRRR